MRAPVDALMLAPEGAPAPRLYDSVRAGILGSRSVLTEIHRERLADTRGLGRDRGDHRGSDGAGSTFDAECCRGGLRRHSLSETFTVIEVITGRLGRGRVHINSPLQLTDAPAGVPAPRLYVRYKALGSEAY